MNKSSFFHLIIISAPPLVFEFLKLIIAKFFSNKFSNKNIYITLKSNNEFTEVVIEDDGIGFSKDILPKIGEPY